MQEVSEGVAVTVVTEESIKAMTGYSIRVGWKYVHIRREFMEWLLPQVSSNAFFLYSHILFGVDYRTAHDGIYHFNFEISDVRERYRWSESRVKNSLKELASLRLIDFTVFRDEALVDIYRW